MKYVDVKLVFVTWQIHFTTLRLERLNALLLPQEMQNTCLYLHFCLLSKDSILFETYEDDFINHYAYANCGICPNHYANH